MTATFSQRASELMPRPLKGFLTYKLKEPPNGGLMGGLVILATFLAFATIVGLESVYGLLMAAMLEDDKRWTRGGLSLAQSVAIFLELALGVVVGNMVDKLGARLTCLIGTAFLALGLLFASSAESEWTFALSYSIMGGTGMALSYGAASIAIGQYFTTRSAFANAFAGTGIGVGTIVLALLIEWSIGIYGWRTCMRLLAMIAAVCLGVASLAYIPVASLDHEHAETPDGLHVDGSSIEVHDRHVQLHEGGGTEEPQHWQDEGRPGGASHEDWSNHGPRSTGGSAARVMGSSSKPTDGATANGAPLTALKLLQKKRSSEEDQEGEDGDNDAQGQARGAGEQAHDILTPLALSTPAVRATGGAAAAAGGSPGGAASLHGSTPKPLGSPQARPTPRPTPRGPASPISPSPLRMNVVPSHGSLIDLGEAALPSTNNNSNNTAAIDKSSSRASTVNTSGQGVGMSVDVSPELGPSIAVSGRPPLQRGRSGRAGTGSSATYSPWTGAMSGTPALSARTAGSIASAGAGLSSSVPPAAMRSPALGSVALGAGSADFIRHSPSIRAIRAGPGNALLMGSTGAGSMAVPVLSPLPESASNSNIAGSASEAATSSSEHVAVHIPAEGETIQVGAGKPQVGSVSVPPPTSRGATTSGERSPAAGYLPPVARHIHTLSFGSPNGPRGATGPAFGSPHGGLSGARATPPISPWLLAGGQASAASVVPHMSLKHSALASLVRVLEADHSQAQAQAQVQQQGKGRHRSILGMVRSTNGAPKTTATDGAGFDEGFVRGGTHGLHAVAANNASRVGGEASVRPPGIKGRAEAGPEGEYLEEGGRTPAPASARGAGPSAARGMVHSPSNKLDDSASAEVHSHEHGHEDHEGHQEGKHLTPKVGPSGASGSNATETGLVHTGSDKAATGHGEVDVSHAAGPGCGWLARLLHKFKLLPVGPDGLPTASPATRVWLDARFWSIAIAMALIISSMTVPETHLATFVATDKGLGNAEASKLFAWMGVAGIVGRLIFGSVTLYYHVDLQFLLQTCGVATGLSMAGLAVWGGSPTYLIFFSLVFGGIGGSTYGFVSPILADYFGLQGLPYALGGTYTVRAPTVLAFSPIAGMLRESIGSYEPIFFVCGVLCVVSALPIGVMNCECRRHELHAAVVDAAKASHDELKRAISKDKTGMEEHE